MQPLLDSEPAPAPLLKSEHRCIEHCTLISSGFWPTLCLCDDSFQPLPVIILHPERLSSFVSMPINLVVTDDHPLILDGIERLVEREPDLNVVARCLDGVQTLRAVRKYQPDVLVLDLHLPDLDGFEVLQSLSNERSTTRVILLTGEINEDEVLEACRLGVRGVVLKEMTPRMLVQCIRKVHGGGQWLEMHSVARALEKDWV